MVTIIPVLNLIKKFPELTERQQMAMELVRFPDVDVPIINAEDRNTIECQRLATMNQLLGKQEGAILGPWDKGAPPDIQFVVSYQRNNKYWRSVNTYKSEANANIEAKQITNCDHRLTCVRMTSQKLETMLRRIYYFDPPCGCANPLYDWKHEYEDLEEAINR